MQLQVLKFRNKIYSHINLSYLWNNFHIFKGITISLINSISSSALLLLFILFQFPCNQKRIKKILELKNSKIEETFRIRTLAHFFKKNNRVYGKQKKIVSLMNCFLLTSGHMLLVATCIKQLKQEKIIQFLNKYCILKL